MEIAVGTTNASVFEEVSLFVFYSVSITGYETNRTSGSNLCSACPFWNQL